jgi:hypothetical protein
MRKSLRNSIMSWSHSLLGLSLSCEVVSIHSNLMFPVQAQIRSCQYTSLEGSQYMKICGKCGKLYQQVIMRMQSGRSLKLLWKESSSSGTENTLAVNADVCHHSYVLEADAAWRITKSGLHTVLISKSYLQVMYHDPLNIGCSKCRICLKNHWELITQTTAILLPFILWP